MHYEHSPKIILIAGPPAAGKSHAAQELVDSLGYRRISLDGINQKVCQKLGIDTSMLPQPLPGMEAAFKEFFVEALREARFKNLVIEGVRIVYPHIYVPLIKAIDTAYGEYAIIRPFHLEPPEEVRHEQYLKRRTELNEREKNKPFETHVNPPLPGFAVVRDNGPILGWAKRFKDAKHPDLRPEFENMVKIVAESETPNPFYQRIELDGRAVIRGFTDSQMTWKNILDMGVDFQGKSVCDLGTMHGYFAFKAEEAGARPVGYDIRHQTIELARAIAQEKGSQCRFDVLDVTRTPLEPFDVIFALNMLHRVSNQEKALENILNSGRELVLEIGMKQAETVLPQVLRQEFKVATTHRSHRNSELLGQRVLLHLCRRSQPHEVPGQARQSASLQA